MTDPYAGQTYWPNGQYQYGGTGDLNYQQAYYQQSDAYQQSDYLASMVPPPPDPPKPPVFFGAVPPVPKPPKPPAVTDGFYETIKAQAVSSFVQSTLKPGVASTASAAVGKFPRKNAGYPKKTDNRKFFCDYCKIECAGEVPWQAHQAGAKHKRRVLQVQETRTAHPQAEGRLTCIICSAQSSDINGYLLHMKGKNHQKAVKYLQDRGKPIPVDPVLAQHSNAKVFGLPSMNFVPAGSLSTTLDRRLRQDACMASVGTAGMSEEAVFGREQVGVEFVHAQVDHTGKLVQYICKLCDCVINDLNARDQHVTGKRHRSQYKVKVDPTLPLYLDERIAPKTTAFPARIVQRQPVVLTNQERRQLEDNYARMLCEKLPPNGELLHHIEDTLRKIEGGLKAVSDVISHRNNKGPQPDPSQRLYLGIMRVGPLAFRTLVKSDTEVEVVLMTRVYPTEAMLKELADLLPCRIPRITVNGQEVTPSVAPIFAQAAVVIQIPGPSAIQYRISMSSPEARLADTAGFTKPPHGLAPQPLLDALAKSRHVKWFGQKECPSLRPLMVLMRTLREKLPVWIPLGDWPLALLIETVLTSAKRTLSPSDAIRRLFEALSAGALLRTVGALVDPCERVQMNVLAYFSNEQRENITASAQLLLRQYTIHGALKLAELLEVDTSGWADAAAGDDADSPSAPKKPRIPSLLSL